MKTKTNIIYPVLAVLALACFGVSSTAQAASGTWLANPTNGDWNTAANWSSNSVPNGSSDIATFDSSNETHISISAPTTVAGIVFNVGASVFNITSQEGQSLSLVGTGITNNSGTVQTFFTEGASSAGNNPGALTFSGSADAADAMIVNNGGTTSGAPGGTTIFQDNARAQVATLIANSGANGGMGGLIEFNDQSIGARTHVQVYGNGTLEVSGSCYPLHSHVPIASVEGDGAIVLACRGLDVGGTNESMTFSGAISGFGTLEKNGTGTLNLTGASTDPIPYIVVNGGTLLTNNSVGYFPKRGPVTVYGGTLGGTGSIGKNVILSSRGGDSPTLSPGNNGPGGLSIGGHVIFGSGSIYKCELNSDTGEVDSFVASVVFTSGGTFSFVDLGNTTLPAGTIFTVIQTRLPGSFIGEFGNLPDGSTFTVGNNTFQASYEGGSNGRDLTLTVQ